jgi:hypothetical protein
MGYFKSVAIDIHEAIEEEVKKGFESYDEKKEVFLEIADEYNVSPDYVWTIYKEADFDYS